MGHVQAGNGERTFWRASSQYFPPCVYWGLGHFLSSSYQSFLSLFLASRSFPMSRLFASGSPSIGSSASVSVLAMNIQDWFPLGLTGLISLQSKGLSRVCFNTTAQKHLSPWAGLNSCLLSQWCYLTISSSTAHSPFAFSLLQHQGLFQWVGCLHLVAKELEFQYQSFQ